MQIDTELIGEVRDDILTILDERRELLRQKEAQLEILSKQAKNSRDEWLKRGYVINYITAVGEAIDLLRLLGDYKEAQRIEADMKYEGIEYRTLWGEDMSYKLSWFIDLGAFHMRRFVGGS